MTDDARVIANLEDRRYEAMLRGDHEVLADLCDPELTYTHSDGSRDSRDSYLQRVRDGFFDYQRLDHQTDRTILAGDCALVVGRMSGDVLINTAVRQLNSACLAVWVRRAGRWQFLAFQPTQFPAG